MDFTSSSRNGIFVSEKSKYCSSILNFKHLIIQRVVFKKVVHGDLAARNVLLSKNGVIKICDFGLSRTFYENCYYTKKSDVLLPVKWMAIESIENMIFSTQSDVWSFGVVMWELFTLSETPYSNIQSHNLLQKLLEGCRLNRPMYATKEM